MTTHSTTTMPTLFISHGAPTLASDASEAHRFLREYGKSLGKPQAIVVLSAHFLAPVATVTSGEKPQTIHDFGGFPAPLYEIVYPAPGDPALAETVTEMLAAGGLPAHADPERGFDHGAWVPLMLMYPDADVPVVQLSIDPSQPPEYHYQLGELLRPLREQGVLIIGSGGATHNLRAFFHAQDGDPAPDWVSAFADWLTDAVLNDRRDDLIHYRERAPHASRNHPTEEHYLPLLSAIGATNPGERHERIHTSLAYGVLTMDAYRFGAT